MLGSKCVVRCVCGESFQDGRLSLGSSNKVLSLWSFAITDIFKTFKTLGLGTRVFTDALLSLKDELGGCL
jgi:hypothetical protein